jgi:hypothetical protein
MPRKAKGAPKAADLPTVPDEQIDQFVKGPMTADAVQGGFHGVQEGAD